MNILSNALNGVGYGCKIKGPMVDTYYGPSALYGSKDLYRGPETTDQLSWSLYIICKNEIWSRQILYIDIRHGNRTRRVQYMTGYNRVNA